MRGVENLLNSKKVEDYLGLVWKLRKEVERTRKESSAMAL